MPSNRRTGPVFSGEARPVRGHVLVDEKTRRRLNMIRWRRIGIGLAGVVLLAGIVALYFSPALRVQDVQVSGAQFTDPTEVENLAALDGNSMFRVDDGTIKHRLALLPMVQSVSIERHWPHTVEIKLAERQAWGQWKVGQDVYTIDAEGVVLPYVPLPDGSPLIIDTSNPVRLLPGDRVDRDSVLLAKSLLATVPEKLILSVIGIEYSAAKGLSLTTDAGYRVVVGDSQDIDYKLAVWARIEQEIGRDYMAGHVLDLRFRDRPAYQ